MTVWWNNLGILGQIFALIAISSTLILIIQTVLLFFGIGGSHGDFDDGIDITGNGEIDTPGETQSDGLTLFSIRGIMAMLSIGGWCGLVLTQFNFPAFLAIMIALGVGFLALLGIAFLMKAAMQLQSSGNIELGNAIGKIGKVYIPIPAKAQGNGKITVTVQDTLIEVDAITTAERKLATGESVRVVATDEIGTLVVEPLINDNE